MTIPVPNRRNRKAVPPAEEGYILLAAVFFLALLVISLAVAAPRIARSIQRDREVEAFHRGMQYRRAIQLYYRKYHAYPPSVDALLKTQEIRFLRKKYIDPVTGKDDWKPVQFGQNKTPMAMGFFGQALSGSTLAGIGPSGGNGLNPSGGTSGSPSGLSQTFSMPSTSIGTPTTPTPSGTTGATGASPTTGPSAGSDQSSSILGPSSQTFGGAGIVGFSPGSSNQSILVYKKKNHFNEWEFTYDPISDMQTVTGGNNGATGLPNGSNPSGIGSSNGQPPNNGFSLTPPPASSTPAPAPPTTPQ
jgi:type II secretory pathway pseudopilin PulG